MTDAGHEAADREEILIVDDDPDYRAFLGKYLEGQGFAVRHAENGKQMTARLEASAPALVLLDLKLPGESGLALMSRLKASAGPEIPVILVTGEREEADRVVGLELGADDYVPKPFSPRELLARIRAVLRRSARAPRQVGTDASGHIFRFADWEMNALTRRLTSPEGESIALPRGEFNVLHAFLRNPGRVLSRDRLLELSRGRDDEVFDRSIDVQIHRLRQRLRQHGSRPAMIETERGVGYRFAESVTVV